MTYPPGSCVECGELWPCEATITRRRDGIPHRLGFRVAHPDAPACDACGDPVFPLAWRAPNVVWLAINGRTEGSLCIPCFHGRAESAGVVLQWTATRYDASDPSTWSIVAQERDDLMPDEAMVPALTMAQEKCDHSNITDDGYCPTCGAEFADFVRLDVLS